MSKYTLMLGDCLEQLKTLPDASVDACVTDPPYGLSFMGKSWDHSVPSVEVWREVLRVLKPGAHLLAFFGTRTYHRGVVAIEDAGFEIRDQIGWAFGSGFPKSLNVGKAIDAKLGAVREVVGTETRAPSNGNGETIAQSGGNKLGKSYITSPATVEAQQWDGWGTALKPAWEPIVVARKSIIGTVADNVMAHGTGGLNVDGCRIGTESTITKHFASIGYGGSKKPFTSGSESGRWPANLIHDGSDEPVRLLGSSERFFYCAKASKADREDGLVGMEPMRSSDRVADDLPGGDNPRNRSNNPRANHHPTVKPTDLMRYLCRLVTPPGGVVMDPFMGSGSTGRGAILEGFKFIGIELDADYLAIAEARIKAVCKTDEQLTMFDLG